MLGAISLSPGQFRWWVAPLGYIASMAVLIGVSIVGGKPEIGQAFVFIGYVALASLIALAVARGAAGQEIGVTTARDTTRILIVSLGAACATILLAELGALVDQNISDSTDTVLARIGFGTSDSSDFLIILSICCLAPLGEEALYRGLIFKAIFNPLRHRFLGAWPAALVAAVIASYVFALSHGGEGQEASVVAIIFVSGILFGLCYAITGSLWAAVLAHSVNNAFALGLPALPSEDIALFNKALILASPIVTWGLLWLWAQVMGRLGKEAHA